MKAFDNRDTTLHDAPFLNTYRSKLLHITYFTLPWTVTTVDKAVATTYVHSQLWNFRICFLSQQDQQYLWQQSQQRLTLLT